MIQTGIYTMMKMTFPYPLKKLKGLHLVGSKAPKKIRMTTIMIPNLHLQNFQRICLRNFFVEQRASDYIYIDVSGNCEWASAMVIVQGQSLRHIQAMSDSTRRFVKACQPYDTSIPSVLSLEGEMDDEWIVLDAGKTILHFMTAGAREKYKIEDIWSDLRDSNLEILQKLSSTSDVEAKKELLLRLQENMTNSWEQNVEADPLFESEEDLKSHLEK
ncbi:hypothetical protein DSO57_1008885 [Entomophthora muscae]|uniref:Uncharacterized protein n=1 Tax=Entomophthora muscae TaxID=34485 RepID=A0ACC2RY83_9FUNG|nr:hypothetical protein DSO57_1008885 [Entomophthora muscae]